MAVPVHSSCRLTTPALRQRGLAALPGPSSSGASAPDHVLSPSPPSPVRDPVTSKSTTLCEPLADSAKHVLTQQVSQTLAKSAS